MNSITLLVTGEENNMAKELKLFTAPWCQPCKQAKVMLGKEDLLDSVSIVDIDEDPETAKKYGINTIPTLLVFDENGTVVDQTRGPFEIAKMVKQYR